MTKRNYDLIVFDWDGTLMDSEAKIVRCFAAAADDVGIHYPGDQAVRDIIGLGLREAFDTLFPGHPESMREAVTERYRQHFLYLDDTAMDFFPGVLEGLESLIRRSYRLAVATGKARRGLDRLFDQHPVAHLFEITRCADEAGSKPHPQMLLDILTHTEVPAQRALMVGDTVFDMEMARNADMPALAVSYGVQPRDRLMQHAPLHCADSFQEVCEWLG